MTRREQRIAFHKAAPEDRQRLLEESRRYRSNSVPVKMPRKALSPGKLQWLFNRWGKA